MPAGAKRASLNGIGYAAQIWRQFARRRPLPGQCATLMLPNARQTFVAIAETPAEADAFVRLALAGRMLKSAAGAELGRVALLAVGPGADRDKTLEALTSAVLAHTFRLPTQRAAPRTRSAVARPSVQIYGAAKLDLPRIRAVAAAGNLTRWLTSLSANILTATAFKTLLARLARRHGLGFRWFGEAALRRAGAGAFLAVAAGNARRDAGIAHLSWRPRGTRRSARPAMALVGKGILFDTGGNNLKPHRSMLDMHTDMSGSAVALSSLIALAELRSPILADAWLAITENRIGPTAYRPQDIVTAANGTTIQVIHTDAEGRMALADTLVLAGRTRPRLIMDFATLTGSCVVALTERMSGVFTNREAILRGPLERAGRACGERIVNFPMDPDFDADLESAAADIMQCTLDSKGDHILAARFLSRFVPADCPWIHMDLASAVRAGGLGHVSTDVTGFGPRFVLEFLLGQDALALLHRP